MSQEDADGARSRFSTVATLEDVRFARQKTAPHVRCASAYPSPTNDPCTSSQLKDVDFLVEAATENVDLKRKIFTDLDAITRSPACVWGKLFVARVCQSRHTVPLPNCRKDIILATNTSSISITKIAAATQRPDKVHYSLFAGARGEGGCTRHVCFIPLSTWSGHRHAFLLSGARHEDL